MRPADKVNRESVRSIQKSIFTVCLDAVIPRVSEDMYRSQVACQMLHGGGSKLNSGNRWFDKTLQVRTGSPQTHTHTRSPAASGLPVPRVLASWLVNRWNHRGCNYPAVSLSLLGLAQKLLSPQHPLQHLRGRHRGAVWP